MSNTNTKTTTDRINAYLARRRTAATSLEIARGARANPNTVRKLLGVLVHATSTAQRTNARRCKVSGKVVSTYTRATPAQNVATRNNRSK